jgi:hypothetical protein
MGGSYELTALMEAAKESASVNDGGSLPGVYQVGTHIDLTPPLRDKGLVGYWTFDEGSGTVAYDSSGKGNNGTWSGTSAHYAAGKVGPYSSIFDGTNNSVNCGNDGSLDLKSELSFSFWVKGPASNNYYGGLVNKRSESPQVGWSLQVGAYGPTVYVRIDTSAGSNQTNGDLTCLDSTWHHAVYVIDDGLKKYYLDGVLKYAGTYNVGSGFSSPANFSIGGTLIGQLDDVHLYNRPLSQTEVSAIYEGTK